MADNIKISKEAPEQKSQDYQFLREEGIKYIQEMAGKIWSDYNLHDPGITILEALCFAITDLGYRASYPINDIIAVKQNGSNTEDIKNFYTARQILHNAPLTKKDYRKLLIDTAIYVNSDKELLGVKNAWIDRSNEAETFFYADVKNSKLSYTKPVDESDQEVIRVGILYDILLEFDRSESYGDLNENTIKGELSVADNPDNEELNGLVIDVKVECPRWDENIDWDKLESITSAINKRKINFQINNLPDNYYYEAFTIVGDKALHIVIKDESDDNEVDGLGFIDSKINEFIFDSEAGPIRRYQEKVRIIQQILKKIKSKLYDNRNLCEDFFKIRALKVEEIAVCADIELDNNANIEKVQAQIYHSIDKFISPSVKFYTIQEMLDKCKTTDGYYIKSIDKASRIFTVYKDITEILPKSATVTVKNSVSNDGDYTVASVSINSYNSSYTDITVNEDIPSEILVDGGIVSVTHKNVGDCLTIDTIFEGPRLEHGFIYDIELENANRKEVINVSDLIQIIMDIPGVIAVKDIQIANVPQDNEDNKILSKNVKWCLKLAMKQNYVPRLSVDLCKFRFYKDNIPFKANAEEVEDLLNELESNERDNKLISPKLDINIPRGEVRNIEDYTSIQEDFPLIYGIGSEGIPNQSRVSTSSKNKREAQAKQLKGYLMFFDQLLANYLSQLAHVKNLFSMNAEKDENGRYKIGRTYYTQPLFEIVPDADALYLDKNNHPEKLYAITEDELIFSNRRNKFLDHLLARFSEQFSDYALSRYWHSDKNKSTDLIDDKLIFINSYPEISSNRGKAFNYKHPDIVWHVDNVSGLEKRTSLLMGIPPKSAELLTYSDDFVITENDGLYSFKIVKGNKVLLKSYSEYNSIDDLKKDIEIAIVKGLIKENYYVSINGSNYYFYIDCLNKENESRIIGTSEIDYYTSKEDAIDDIEELIIILENEFNNNQESNRNNITCPFENYLTFEKIGVVNDGYQVYTFSLYSKPFNFTTENLIISGKVAVKASDLDTEKVDVQQKILGLLVNIDSIKSFSESNLSFTIVGWDNEETRENTIKFIKSKFINREGFHVIEHPLLRPKHRTIQVDIKNFGDLFFSIETPVVEAKSLSGKIFVEDDHTTEFKARSKANIIAGYRFKTEQNNLSISIESAKYHKSENKSEFKLSDKSFTEISDKDIDGALSYQVKIQIESINKEGTLTLATRKDGYYPKVSGKVEIKGSSNSINDGFYFVVKSELNKIVLVSDALMPVILDNDCSNQMKDPYSCIASVVLPYWPERFSNNDFRKLFEKTLRMETPAHIFLRICWVNNHHMQILEEKYKRWIIENSRKVANEMAISDALKELIETLYQLRNVYPVGTLYDEEEHDTLQNTIILNNTMIGNA
ncbi:MAG: hypothetical protein EHM93_07545 [Bacteroidales bacterium]|nr:MAG: hypothetical protein EHM93_07545 [Bacteroidales bacterium]